MAEHIDKEDVLKIIDSAEVNTDYWSVTIDGYVTFHPDTFDKLHKEIDHIPAADVAPVVHAKWIDHTEDALAGYWECSNCIEPWVLMEGTPEENKMNYCPQCGAKMDLED